MYFDQRTHACAWLKTIYAGLDPDAVISVAGNEEDQDMEVDVTKTNKKRLPSGSPDGKLWESVDSIKISVFYHVYERLTYKNY